MEAATGPGEGQPAVLRLNHTYETLDAEKGVISFTNGTSVQHDIVIGADGVGVSDNSIVYPVGKSQPQGPFITVFCV
jgi:salicylate hydroxylase